MAKTYECDNGGSCPYGGENGSASMYFCRDHCGLGVDEDGPDTDEDGFERATCPGCGATVDKLEMQWTTDCYGIPFRRVCESCYDKLMAVGYDGRHYDTIDAGESIYGEDW